MHEMVFRSDFSALPCLWSGAGERNLNHISWEEESLDDVEIACFASLMRECVSLLNLQCPTQTPVCVNSTLNSWDETISAKIIVTAWLCSFLPLPPVHQHSSAVSYCLCSEVHRTWLWDCVGTLRTWPEPVIEQLVKGCSQPQEHRCTQLSGATRKGGPRVHLSLTSFKGWQPEQKHFYMEIASLGSFQKSPDPWKGVSYSFFNTSLWLIPFLSDPKTGQRQQYLLLPVFTGRFLTFLCARSANLSESALAISAKSLSLKACFISWISSFLFCESVQIGGFPAERWYFAIWKLWLNVCCCGRNWGT